MADYALIEADNKVTNIIIVSDNIENPLDFIANKLKLSGTWIKSEDENPAKIGGYLLEDGTFSEPKPFPSWTLDEENNWQPPVPYPDPEKFYIWNEELLIWEIGE